MSRQRATVLVITVRWLGIALLVLTMSCLRESTQTCSTGVICPAGLVCVDTAGTTVNGRLCATSTCGDGSLQGEEACDDGNNRSGDGCPADCSEPCGDGVLDQGEVCDDGNTDNQDGCTADCGAILEELFSPSSVSFVVTEGDPAASTIVRLRLDSAGDSVLIGYAPGAPPPDWLSVIERPPVANAVELELQASDTSVVGERATRLRVTVSRQRSSRIDVFGLPVRLRVEPSDLAVAVAPTTLSYTAVSGDLVAPPQRIAVAFNGDQLDVVSAPAWASVASVAAGGPLRTVFFDVAVTDTSFAPGTTLVDQLVVRTTRGSAERIGRVTLIYDVLPPPDTLEIIPTPAGLVFSAITQGSLPPPQAVQVAFTGATISVDSKPPWLSVTLPMQPIASPASIAVAITTTALSGDTRLTGSVVLRTARFGSVETVTLFVEYRVEPKPEIQFVAPYVVLAGRAGTVRARGRSFPVDRPVGVQLGDVALAPVMADGPTQLTLAYPALPAGRYPATLQVDGAISPRSPELVVVAEPPDVYQVIPAPGNRTRLLYDAERREIYAVDRQAQQLSRLAYRDGSWVALAPIVIPGLTDAALAPDGRSMMITAGPELSEISLNGGQFRPVLRATVPPYTCNFFTAVATANNGKVLVLGDVNGSGFCRSHHYDLRDHSLTQYEWTYQGEATGSADGSVIYFGSGILDPLFAYDTHTGGVVSTAHEVPVRYLSASGDGTRVAVNATHPTYDTHIYNASLELLGAVPSSTAHGYGTVLVSRDGRRVFVYDQDDVGARLKVYDLEGALDSNSRFPLLRTVALPDAVTSDALYLAQMTSNLDDSVVFIFGTERILVVPMPAN